MAKGEIGTRRSGAWEFLGDSADDVEPECDEGCPDSHEYSNDSTFCVPHQSKGRLVEFDWLTVTIDEIMEKCAYPEKKRDFLTEAHRVGARSFLRYHKGPRPDVLPILEDSPHPVGA